MRDSRGCRRSPSTISEGLQSLDGSDPYSSGVPVSESELKTKTGRSWKRRMGMDVVDAGHGLARQSRGVEIVDVGDLGVKDVEQLEHEASLTLSDAPSDLSIPESRARGLDARVLDERTRAEVADADAAEERLTRFDGRADGNHAIQRAGNLVAHRIVVGETSSCEREITIEGQPGLDARVVGPFDADTPARTSGLRRAGVSDEQQL